MKITSEWLKKNNACDDGYSWFSQNFPADSEIEPLFSKLAEDKRDDWANWILFRISDQTDFATHLKLWIGLCIKRDGEVSTTGDEAHSSTTGWRAHSSTTGWRAHSSTTGDEAHSSTTGDEAHSICLGRRGKAKSGDKGIIAIVWRDESANRDRLTVGYVGENGIKPDTWYRADKNGALIETSLEEEI